MERMSSLRTRRCSVCMRVRTQHAARAARTGRHYGYALRGMPATASRTFNLRGSRYSVLGIFELEYGCIHYCARRGSIDSDELYDMISNHVVSSRSSRHSLCMPLGTGPTRDATHATSLVYVEWR